MAHLILRVMWSDIHN